MRYTIILLLFSCAVCGQDNSKRKIEGYYFGSWDRSSWGYEFFSNNTFCITTGGHYGNTKSIGNYTINKDTLILTSTDTINKQIFHRFENAKYIIDGDSCLIDVRGHNYCKNRDFIKADRTINRQ